MSHLAEHPVVLNIISLNSLAFDIPNWVGDCAENTDLLLSATFFPLHNGVERDEVGEGEGAENSKYASSTDTGSTLVAPED